METEKIIRPSLLSSNFLALGKDLDQIKSLGITHCHFDVMDGTFVPGISFGEPLFKAVQEAYGKDIVFDVHLMTRDPLRQFSYYADLGAKEISFHYEALTPEDLEKVKSLRQSYPDVQIGLAISPETDVSLILGLANSFDFFLVMSVVPGKGGQGFIEGSETKIARLAATRNMNHLSFKIGVDGGINEKTAYRCYQAGADYLVCGSYYFKASDKAAVLKQLGQVLEGK
jgi:ribulose-phosphate 3-epimerase